MSSFTRLGRGALTIMAGLTLGTVLTMVAVPVLYATLCRVAPSEK